MVPQSRLSQRASHFAVLAYPLRPLREKIVRKDAREVFYLLQKSIFSSRSHVYLLSSNPISFTSREFVHKHLKQPRLGHKTLACVPERQVVFAYGERHRFLFTRLKAQLLETFQFFHRAGDATHEVADVELRHFFAGVFARVGHVNRHGEGFFQGVTALKVLATI